ncbi:MAG: helix-turn-helix transcriptional regulator [Clostridia bacterium]|nr:helix-turn-helix transcriptional regulator [Clostridia bacterium]
MELSFIRNRITELRMKKGVSEVKMSRELGHSDSYITQITSGRSNPSIQELLYIIDYLGVSPSLFFEEETIDAPILIQQINRDLRNLSEADLLMLISVINRIK